MFGIELTICIKIDLALNNLKKLICHKTQPTFFFFFFFFFFFNIPLAHLLHLFLILRSISFFSFTCNFFIVPLSLFLFLPSCICMIKISRIVHKSNTYNGFTGNISFFIPRTFSNWTLFEFFFVLAI